MCVTCGCGVEPHEHQHEHQHDARLRTPQATAAHAPRVALPRKVSVEERLLAKNDRLAAGNRALLEARGALMLNLLSSPGAGKTTLLERTARRLGPALLVVEGDQATDNDAQRIRAAGCRAVQLNTGAGCHLDARMIAGALAELAPPPGATLLVENVGNLVCPALFDLGERLKVVVASVTEGEDKPLKYPHMFRAAGLVLLNKVDLLPHVTFDVERFEACLRQVNPAAPLLRLSATRGDGLEAWFEWLEGEAARAALVGGGA